MTFGVDVSHHQSPTAVPWDTIAESATFCVCRAVYGSRRDRQVVEHMYRARAAGLQVGLYLFFRSTEHPIEQLSAFRAAAQAAGYRPGDILPALDVEADPNVAEVSPSWEPAVREMCDALTKDFGGVVLYITAREWSALGMPTWCLSLPLWTAHYVDGKPRTPGNVDPLIHQHRVGPYDPEGPGGVFQEKGKLTLDQNRAFGPLPTVQRVPWHPMAPAPTVPVANDDGDALTIKRAAVHAWSQQFDTLDMLRSEALRDMLGSPDDDGGPDAA